MTAEQSHIKWKEETINLLAEIGIEDYTFDTEHSWVTGPIDIAKLRPISRELNITEKMIIGCINDRHKIKLPYESATLF